MFHLADVDTCDASYVLLVFSFLTAFLTILFRSAIEILHELLVEYHNRQVGIYITHLRSGPKAMFIKSGMMELLGADAFQGSVAEAISKIESSGRGH